jgi:hypothetical protein
LVGCENSALFATTPPRKIKKRLVENFFVARKFEQR